MANSKIKWVGKVRNIPVEKIGRKYAQAGTLSPNRGGGKMSIRRKDNIVTMSSSKNYTN